MPPPEYFQKAKLKIKKKVEQKYGVGPYSAEQKQMIRKEVKKKMMLKIRAYGETCCIIVENSTEHSVR